MAMSMSIEEKLVITWGKEQMVPRQKIVADIKFICLDKWNRSLIKLLTGRALDMREGKETGSLRSPVWDEIINARQDKANELLQEALQHESTEDQQKSKRKQPLKATPKHQILLPVHEQVQVRGHTFHILLEGINTQTFWMEFNLENLLWLKKEIEGSQAVPRKSKRRRGEGRASLSTQETQEMEGSDDEE